MMGEDPTRRVSEIAALREGLELGLTLIDTAEMYGNGAAEELIGEALGNVREDVFLVSKAYPHNASLTRLEQSCEASLARLRTDHLDLYLLHWRGSIPLAETVEAMGRLIEAGKILRWGVSNLDIDDMDELLAAGGSACATSTIPLGGDRNWSSSRGCLVAACRSWPTAQSNREGWSKIIGFKRLRGSTTPHRRRSRSRGCSNVLGLLLYRRQALRCTSVRTARKLLFRDRRSAGR